MHDHMHEWMKIKLKNGNTWFLVFDNNGFCRQKQVEKFLKGQNYNLL